MYLFSCKKSISKIILRIQYLGLQLLNGSITGQNQPAFFFRCSKKSLCCEAVYFIFPQFFLKKRAKEKTLMNKINQSVNLQLKSSFPKFHFFTHGGSFFVQKIKFKLLRVRIFFRIQLKNVYRSRLDMYALFFLEIPIQTKFHASGISPANIFGKCLHRNTTTQHFDSNV